MYKRDSSQHTDTLSSAIINTTLSDTLHLNINTNAQTMSHDALLANEKTSASNYFYLNHPGGGGGSSSSRGGQDMSSASQDPFSPQDQGFSAADYGYSAEDDPGYSPSPQLNQTFATTCLRQEMIIYICLKKYYLTILKLQLKEIGSNSLIYTIVKIKYFQQF